MSLFQNFFLHSGNPIMFTPQEITFLTDTQFFPSKAKISAKIRHALEDIYLTNQQELKKQSLIIPNEFSLEAFQFVKGEYLEDYPYQYLDYPKFYTREIKFSFRTLFWWGHHIVFALILEGGYLRRYKENLINRFSQIADHGVCLCLSNSLWEWKCGPGYTLELTHDRKTEVAAVLANRPFLKLATFTPFNDPSLSSGKIVNKGHQALQSILPIITI